MAATQDVLASILAELRSMRTSQQKLESRLDSLVIGNGGASSGAAAGAAVAAGGATTGAQPIPARSSPSPHTLSPALGPSSPGGQVGSPPSGLSLQARKYSMDNGNASKQEYLNWARNSPAQPASAQDKETASVSAIYPSRAILTTYPGQVGVNPLPLKWGAATAAERGPILASRQKASIGLRNAIGSYSGAYSIYRALSIATGSLDPNQRPNYTNTEPTFDVKPNPSWFDPSKICTIDPWGHLAQVEFKDQIDRGIDIRPTMSITRAHLKIAELDDAVKKGRLSVDGKIVINSVASKVAEEIIQDNKEKLDKDAKEVLENMAQGNDAGVEVNVSKVAFEHVWMLDLMAKRLGVSETLLRRSLFEDTGGMYPELLTRPDLKAFLPPISGGTAYIFGPTPYLSDPSKELAVRVHDACGGSDVFGSDICTCRPYLLHGIEEAIKCAQRGGVGLVVYFQKEGRALGEVTKYLVYNARKRGVDSASMYFARTESIAGVKDMRFQAFMPDILHWLGVQKIDYMYSMSDMKHDAIVNSGISILSRHDIPAELIPPDSQVEIQAKINAGYFSSKGAVTAEDLTKTVGRAWEDLEH